MTYPSIKQLRAENRHEDAYKLSKLGLESNPGDIWAIRKHSWSIYYMVKKHVQAGEAIQANLYLKEFETLNVPEDEKLIYERLGYFKKVLTAEYLKAKALVDQGKYLESFDWQMEGENPDKEQLAWTIFFMLRSFNKTGKPHKIELADRLNKFKAQINPEKKIVYKLILQQLIKLPEDLWTKYRQTEYLEHFLLFEILEEDDYQKQEWEGKKIISLAERLHIAYSKALLRENSTTDKIQSYINNTVVPVLEQYPGMLYVPYFKAKLLLGIGDQDSGIKAFLPFAKKKSGEFWVWQVFAEAFEKDKALYFSCLCKAMTCRAKLEFLSGIKERLIAYLVKSKQYDLAKSELDSLLEIRQKQGWGLRSIHQNYLRSAWYPQAKAVSIKYTDHKYLAESLIGAKPRVVLEVLVSHINLEKKLFGFLTPDKRQGFGKYTQEPELWQIYKLEGNFGSGEYFEVKKQKKTLQKDFPLIKSVGGKIIKKPLQKFGFVEGAFVDPFLVQRHLLQHDDRIEGQAILSPIKGKKDWAWKLVSLIKK